MFKTGDLIQYGSTGVCRITEIKDVKLSAKEKKPYYVLQPLYQNCVIQTPVDNKKVFMRPIISKEEADNLIDMIPTIEVEEYHSHVMRELTEHYEASIQSHNCEDLLELTMSIYSKRRSLNQLNKKIGVIDERFMKRGEELLYGELAAALDIPRDEVQDYIAQRMKKFRNGKGDKTQQKQETAE